LLGRLPTFTRFLVLWDLLLFGMTFVSFVLGSYGFHFYYQEGIEQLISSFTSV